MKNNRPESKRNPYATNRGGKISAPQKGTANEPRSSVTRGDDLRK